MKSIEFPFDTRVNKTESCWIWTGPVQSAGYGIHSQHGLQFLAHRFSYVRVKGIIPFGKDLHHRCRNKICVNPDHLEIVSRKYHDDSGPSVNRKKQFCRKGHEYTFSNTRIRFNGSRACIECGLRWCRESNKRRAKKENKKNDQS